MRSFNFCSTVIREIPDPPRYQLPVDVPPPPGMTREQFNDWAGGFLGVDPSGNVAKDGEIVGIEGAVLLCNPRTFDAMLASMVAMKERYQVLRGFASYDQALQRHLML